MTTKQVRAVIAPANVERLNELQALMGHTSISDTVNYLIQTYAEVAIRHQQKAKEAS